MYEQPTLLFFKNPPLYKKKQTIYQEQINLNNVFYDFEFVFMVYTFPFDRSYQSICATQK